MKQTKLLLATIAMLWCSLTASAHDFEVGGIYYNITSGTDLTVEVTYQGSSYDEYSNEYSGAVTIPSAVTYNGKTYRVTEIGFAAFYYCSSLTVLNIPESITGIRNGAFFQCSSLTTINIPKGVMTIELQTFCGCSSLISITIPEGVTSIGDYAFYGCSSLTGINIPESVTSIGGEAFYGCSSLTGINIPESVTSIGGEAFHGTAWYDNQPDGVIYIDKVLYTYKGTMPANTSIEVKEGTEYIANYAFYGCSSLTAINIPESVTSIGGSAFAACSSLTAITVEEGNTTYDSRDNCNAIIETSSNCLIVGCSATIIPESVTSIGNGAFYGCSSLTSITIPESVTSIGPYAFYGTAWYDNQPDGVIYIDKVLYTYKGTMPANTSIEVKEGTEYIANQAFSGCSSLTSITIPESVRSIGRYAFSGCSSLTSITLSEGVTSIGDGAFYGCSSLTSITIPESVTSIGSRAFYRCYSLTSITIPESVTEIGDYAFYECWSLTSITIPESSQLTSIGDYAFYNCIRLYTVINCSNLGISKGSTAYGYVACYAKKVLNGSNLSTVGDYQFYTSNGVHYLANYSGNDSNLVLPDSYNGENYKIDDYAFYGCSSLTSITIPEGVTSIGNYAFCSCN